MPFQFDWSSFTVFVMILTGIFIAGRLVVAIKDKIKQEANRPASQKQILWLLAKENRFYAQAEIWEHIQKTHTLQEYSREDLNLDLEELAQEGKIEPQLHFEQLGQANKLRYKLAL